MKMKLLALAIAGAFVAPVAMAEHEEGAPANAMGNVTIYGQVNGSFYFVRDGAKDSSTSTTQVSNDASRLGVKGSEDLGGGLNAIWQIETGFNVDGTNDQITGSGFKTGSGLGTRNTFVGLNGAAWGTAILGRHDTPYKTATRGLDLFADTIADNRSLMGMTGGGITTHDVRATDVLAYVSPNMGGFSVAVGYVAGAENAAFPNDKKGDAWSAYGMYNAGPINASLSYQRVNGGNADTNLAQPIPFGIGDDHDATAWKLGGGYSMDAFAVNAVYEHTTGDLGFGDKLDQNNWYLAGKFSFTPNDAVKLAYTSAGKTHGGTTAEITDSDAHQWSVGYDHNLSKRTMVYALYTKLDNKANADYALGLRNGMTGGASGGFESDPSAFALGIKHSF